MRKDEFGILPDGRTVEVVTLTNGHLTVRLLKLGAIMKTSGSTACLIP